MVEAHASELAAVRGEHQKELAHAHRALHDAENKVAAEQEKARSEAMILGLYNVKQLEHFNARHLFG